MMPQRVFRIVVSDFPAPSADDAGFELNAPGDDFPHNDAMRKAAQVFEANGRNRYVFLQHNQIAYGTPGMWHTFATFLPLSARAQPATGVKHKKGGDRLAVAKT